MYRLIETIKIIDGIPQNLEWHNLRMSKSSELLNGIKLFLEINDFNIPEIFRKGIVKCRITYSNRIETIEYEQYLIKNVNSFKIIFNDKIDYSHKFADRSQLIKLYEMRVECDDIIIIKNGLVTDSFYANLCFEKNGELFTPAKPLLNGTKRQKLINEKRIIPIDITPDSISAFNKIHLLNSMIDLFDYDITVTTDKKLTKP
jgi:4-amino-4-deoxychorismate lyase